MSYQQEGRFGIGLVTGQFYPHSFTLADLARFEDFVGEHTHGCITYADVAHESVLDTEAIAIRHDVDHSIVHAHRFASWEAERGITSSYYVLPTAPYAKKEPVIELALQMQEMGHEIGVHNDSMTYAGGRLPNHAHDLGYIRERAILWLSDWVEELRMAGLNVYGCADHGGGEPKNVDLWTGSNAKTPAHAEIAYECYALHKRPNVNYISDNRGTWRSPLVKVDEKQTHVLIHPEHWRVP